MRLSSSRYSHPFHLADSSPWPLLAAISVLGLACSATAYFHNFSDSIHHLRIAFYALGFILMAWWRDIIRESTYLGEHTTYVQRGLRLGMILFIVSEVMFFAAFFWAFFHSSLAPAVQVGGVWPPEGISYLNAWALPFLNTMLLLLSGAAVTWAHHEMRLGELFISGFALFNTIGLGIVFTRVQYHEYENALFHIGDGVYSSAFYLATGFHGLHVLIGTTFLFVCLVRLYDMHFTRARHFGFEAAAWYWHFVDVVWLFLFVSIYWWGS